MGGGVKRGAEGQTRLDSSARSDSLSSVGLGLRILLRT
jgi:hypothetical protein